MNNPEFDPEMLEDIDPDKIGVDVSGYSEKRADKQIDKKDDSGQGSVKQFNRLTPIKPALPAGRSGLNKGGSFIPPKKVKKNDGEKEDDHIVFESK